MITDGVYETDANGDTNDLMNKVKNIIIFRGINYQTKFQQPNNVYFLINLA